MFTQGAEVSYLQRREDGVHVLRLGFVVAVYDDRCIVAVPPSSTASDAQIAKVKSIDGGSEVPVVFEAVKHEHLGESGKVTLEGCISDDYYRVRELLYDQYAII